MSANLQEQEGEFHLCRGKQEEEEIVCDNDDYSGENGDDDGNDE